MFHIFHNWSKWEIISDRRIGYTNTIGGVGQMREIVQMRTCLECNLKQYKTTDID